MDLEQQFLALYDEAADALYRHCYFRVHDQALAEDLVQEAFMRVWNKLAEGGEIEHPKAFLFRTASNLIIDYYRRKKESSLDALREEGFDPAGEGAASVSAPAEIREMLGVVEELPPDYREAILLRYSSGLDVEEIARHTGESANAISVRIHRAVKKLQELMHYEPN